MNYKKLYAISLTASVVLMAASALPASALGINAATKLSAALDTAGKTKADTEIAARIKALDDLQARISQMQKVSANQKANLDANIQLSVSDMTDLQAKIDADTDNATLKTDIQSITKSYRIYLLVLPQGRITAAGDRIITIVGLMNDLSMKLQTRMNTAQAAGQNVTALNTSLADMNSKASDANVQAQGAINEIIVLKPDNGDATIFQSNQNVLKDARAKIKAAVADLKTARQDAGSIVKSLTSIKASATATTTPQ